MTDWEVASGGRGHSPLLEVSCPPEALEERLEHESRKEQYRFEQKSEDWATYREKLSTV